MQATAIRCRLLVSRGVKTPYSDFEKASATVNVRDQYDGAPFLCQFMDRSWPVAVPGNLKKSLRSSSAWRPKAVLCPSEDIYSANNPCGPMLFWVRRASARSDLKTSASPHFAQMRGLPGKSCFLRSGVRPASCRSAVRRSTHREATSRDGGCCRMASCLSEARTLAR